MGTKDRINQLVQAKDHRNLSTFLATDPSWENRRDAAEALGTLATQEVIPDLVKALQTDQHWVVRFKAAESLGNIGDPLAIQPLIEALKDSQNTVREYAANALGSIGQPAVQPIIQILGNVNTEVFGQLVLTLANIGDPSVTEVLVSYLDDSNWNRRASVAKALGILKAERAFEPLMNRLNDPSGFVRMSVAVALGEYNDPRSIRALVDSLSDWEMYGSVASALEKLGWEPSTDQRGVMYWLWKGDWDRCVAMETLAVQPLSVVAKTSDREYRAAIEALGRIGTPALDALIDLAGNTNEKVRRVAVEAIKSIDDNNAREFLARFEAEEAKKHERSVKALRQYWKVEGFKWWDSPGRIPSPVCDRCNRSLSRANCNHQIASRRAVCDSCAEQNISMWKENGYSESFFSYDLQHALAVYQENTHSQSIPQHDRHETSERVQSSHVIPSARIDIKSVRIIIAVLVGLLLAVAVIPGVVTAIFGSSEVAVLITSIVVIAGFGYLISIVWPFLRNNKR